MTKPRTVFVDVQINQINPLDFTVVPSPKNDPQLPTDQNGGIIFENDHHPGFDIHFELKGNTQGYFFPPTSQKHDAIWSQRGTVCPTQTGVWEIFRPIRTVESCQPPECRTLIVRNFNPKPAQGAFQYNLRVTNGSDWKDLDPGGTNTNGPSKMTLSYASIATVSLTTAVLSALATFAAFRFAGLVGATG